MATIAIRTGKTRARLRPSGVMELNHGHPLAPRIGQMSFISDGVAMLASGMRNSVYTGSTGKQIIGNSGGVPSVGKFGESLFKTDTAAYSLLWACGNIDSGAFTHLTFVDRLVDSSGADWCVGSTGSFVAWKIANATRYPYRHALFGGDLTGNIACPMDGFVFGYSGSSTASDCNIWVDGKLAANGVSAIYQYNPSQVGGYVASTTSKIGIACTITLTGILTTEQVASFTDDPWQLVLTRRTRIYSIPSSTWTFDEAIYPNGVSLTHLSGAYTNITDDPSSPDANWLTLS